MNIIANENVFEPIIEFLKSEGHNVISVRDSHLSGATDEEIYARAVNDNLIILTMDKDFSRIRRFPPERCGGILVIKLYRMPVDETTELFKAYFKVLEFEKFQYLIMKSFIIEKNEHKIFRGSGMKLGNGDISRIVGQRGFSGGIPLNILNLLMKNK
ncbi:MAG: DUF5615 family PIN-like protein [bacterium]